MMLEKFTFSLQPFRRGWRNGASDCSLTFYSLCFQNFVKLLTFFLLTCQAPNIVIDVRYMAHILCNLWTIQYLKKFHFVSWFIFVLVPLCYLRYLLLLMTVKIHFFDAAESCCWHKTYQFGRFEMESVWCQRPGWNPLDFCFNPIKKKRKTNIWVKMLVRHWKGMSCKRLFPFFPFDFWVPLLWKVNALLPYWGFILEFKDECI